MTKPLSNFPSESVFPNSYSSLVNVKAESAINFRLPSAPNGVEVCISTLPDKEENLLAKLPTDYAEELQCEMKGRFGRTHRRMEWLASRVMLHRMSPGARISYHATGRPYLAGVSQDCPLPEISISHSHHLIALCRANRRVGVDIEVWSGQALRVAVKYLARDEQEWVAAGTDSAPDRSGQEWQQRKAVLLWTAKEAAYKYYDDPHLGLADLHLSGIEKKGKDAWQARMEVPGRACAFLYIYAMQDGALSICVGPM